MHKSEDMLELVLDASERAVAAVGELETSRMGVTALAVALGRVCHVTGESLDHAIIIAKAVAASDKPLEGGKPPWES